MTDQVNDYCIILTTCGSREDARRIARHLVEQRLGACVQMTGIESVYGWEGEVAEDEEVLLLIKSRHDKYAAIESAIIELHPYDVPELVLVPISTGLESYLGWIDQSLAE